MFLGICNVLPYFMVFLFSFISNSCLFTFFSLLKMNLFWFGVNAVALGLSGTNAYLYLQASKRRGLFFYLPLETNQEVNLLKYIPGDVRNKAMK